MTLSNFPVLVTATNPLTVTFPDGSSHRAIGLPGASYSTSAGTYVAFWEQPNMPYVVPSGTATGTDLILDGGTP